MDNPKFIQRKLPKPVEGWKDLSGKPHKAHVSAAAFCKRAAWIAWRLRDADPSHGGEREQVNDVKLQNFIPLEVLIEQEEMIKVTKLPEYLLNDINEYSTGLFLRHVPGQAVADPFGGRRIYSEWIFSSLFKKGWKKRESRSL